MYHHGLTINHTCCCYMSRLTVPLYRSLAGLTKSTKHLVSISPSLPQSVVYRVARCAHQMIILIQPL